MLVKVAYMPVSFVGDRMCSFSSLRYPNNGGKLHFYWKFSYSNIVYYLMFIAQSETIISSYYLH